MKNKNQEDADDAHVVTTYITDLKTTPFSEKVNAALSNATQ